MHEAGSKNTSLPKDYLFLIRTPASSEISLKKNQQKIGE